MPKGINVLYVNAMGPTRANPQGGIFVARRINALRSLGIHVDAVSVGIHYSKIAQLLLKLRGYSSNNDELLNEQLGIRYDIANVKIGFWGLVAGHFFTRVYGEIIFLKLKKQIKKYSQIDIIHLHWMWPVGIGVLLLSRFYNIPYVVTCHGSDVNFTLHDRNLNRPLTKVLENASAVEFVSEALRQSAISAGYSGDNGYVINNGIDTEVFYDQMLKRRKVVGFVGNLITVKGADRLPEIFHKIYNECDEVQFVVVGKGELSDKIRDQMRDLPVRFTGLLSSEELSKEYAQMSVLVIPSRAEGYPCVVKEAQACGVIPIANNVGGLCEAVGKYGYVISGQDEKEVIEKISNTVIRYFAGELKMPIDQMAQEAMGHDWQDEQRKSVEIYKIILTRLVREN